MQLLRKKKIERYCEKKKRQKEIYKKVKKRVKKKEKKKNQRARHTVLKIALNNLDSIEFW